MDGGADSLFTGSLGVICGCVCATCVISASDQRQHSPSASPSFGQRQQIVVDSERCVSVWRAVVNNNRVRKKTPSSFG